MKAKRIVMAVAVLVIVLAMALAIVACEETTYTVSLYAMGGYGRVECTNNSDHTEEEGDYGYRYDYRYKEGDHVSIEATAGEGYRFVGWYDERDVLISESNSYSFEMGNSDITYIAKFEKLYTLQLKCNFPQGGFVSGEGEYAEGENVTITATANEGHKFVGWYVNGEFITDSAEYTLTMGDSGITYTAKFKIDIDPNFNCTLLDNGTYSLDSLKDKSVKMIIIPEYITEIGKLECRLDTINYTGTLAQWCAMSGLGNIMGDYIMGGNPTLYIAGESVADDLVIPDSVTIIGDYAFRGCFEVKSVTIPESVRSIGDYAFSACSRLESVTIPDSVRFIGDYAFSFCSWLRRVTIPDSVTSIGDYAFADCSSLTSVTIPDSVTSIGEYAFADCYALAEVYNLSSLKITKGSKDNGYVAYYALDVYNSLAEPSKLTRKDGMILHTNGNNVTLVRYIDNKYGNLIIPDNVRNIGARAFYDCERIESVTIPFGVSNIGDYAFVGCSSLKSVIFENASGWFVSQSSNATGGADITVTDPSKNAKYLTDTYRRYYWKRG